MKMKIRFQIVLTLCFCCHISASIVDYYQSLRTFFGYSQKSNGENYDILQQTVPYEVSSADEKFLAEAAKLTDVALSELDSCQHRVVLKLQTACNKMNDEQLAKMAVMLLNCQSAAEGRRIYPCTDAMSIRDCTTSMDADTWNSYHLMSNRARAVCYSVRQAQFRGLTELTINKLMEAAHSHLINLNEVARDQKKLQDVTQETLETITIGQANLEEQQKDLQRAQLQGQLAVEDNIHRLINEKRYIIESHQQLAQMTQAVQHKLEEANKQLLQHSGEAKINQQELLDDLINIQNKAQIIFQRIDESSKLLLEQSEIARAQYEATLAQLAEVNATVHSLVGLVGGTKQALEERLLWLTSSLGGTDQAIERLYAMLWHTAFLLIAMICCAFLTASSSTRLAVAVLVPLNLVVTLQESEYKMDPVGLATSLGVIALTQTIFFFILGIRKNYPVGAISWIQKLTPKKLKSNGIEDNTLKNNSTPYTNRHSALNNYTSTLTDHQYKYKSVINQEKFDSTMENEEEEGSETSRYSRSRTPSMFNGSLKTHCHGFTRAGTPCKLTSQPGREYCYRHQTGNSVMIS